jgi:hypothetical protein
MAAIDFRPLAKVALPFLVMAAVAWANCVVAAFAPDFPAKGRLSTARTVALDFNGLHRRYLIQAPSGKGPFPVVVPVARWYAERGRSVATK